MHSMMRSAMAAGLVFVGGFIIMVLEIVGMRFLARDFGSSFYVWVSQIGVVLIALAVGYYLGGALADRWQRLSRLALLLIPAGVILASIPDWGGRVNNWISSRHSEEDIPLLWQKLDPVMGGALVFLLPCAVLATLSPYMIRLATHHVRQVGRASGLIIACSTIGSIAGVFIAGFVLIEKLSLTQIFRFTGGLTVLLGLVCIIFDRCWLAATPVPASAQPAVES